jgi:hypothetical protein
MVDRPILFSAPMVRALLERRKTQTRRVFKGIEHLPGGWHIFNAGGGCIAAREEDVPEAAVDYAPFVVDDRLWVRETFKPVHSADPSRGARYRADVDRDQTTWKPGIHMPRWASRLTLAVTDVRVQRLQDINEEDALAEGIIVQHPNDEDEAWNRQHCEDEGLPYSPLQPVWLAPGTKQGFGPRRNDPQWGPTPQFAYRMLWDSINAKRGFGWDTNPWIVAVTFAVERRNIDAPVPAAVDFALTAGLAV